MAATARVTGYVAALATCGVLAPLGTRTHRLRPQALEAAPLTRCH